MAPPTSSRPDGLTRAEVRELDRRAVEDFGLPGIVLMENAGRGAADLAARLWPEARTFAIACGGGNNGGDGCVIARHLELLGKTVRILLAVEPEAVKGDAAIALAVAVRGAVPVVPLAGAAPAEWGRHLAGAEVVIDALLGTGASGAPRGTVAAAIEAIQAWRAATPGGRVLAVDLPSGLDCDSGDTPGACVRSDATATFVAPKRGFQLPDARAFTGPVHVVGIGAPRRLLAEFGAG